MNIDLKDVAEKLGAYEITNSGISLVAKGMRSVESTKLTENDNEDEEEFPEGKEFTRLHKRKERNPTVVRKKKRKVLGETGKLECEVCGFDFEYFYGQLGYGFSECHHTIPVSKLTDGYKTKLSDLAIVCANCHRMLHKSRPQSQSIITISELRTILKTNAPTRNFQKTESSG